MRLKRAQENQNEERYTNTRVEVAAEPDPGAVESSRASQDVLEGRRIISASKRFRRSGAGTGTMTPSSSSDAPPASSASSSNPFAFTTLARPAATTSAKSSLFSFNSGRENNEQISQSTKPNPFDNVAFTSNSSTATTGAAKSLAAPPPSITPTTFSFNATPSAHNPPAASSRRRPSSRAKKEEMRDLNMTLWQTIVDHWEGKHYVADYSHFMKEYLTHAEEIMQREEDGDGKTNDGNLPSRGPSSSNPSFSFGTTSTTTSAPPPTNSFAAGTSSSAPSFSFGASSSAPSISHVPAFSSGNGDDNDDDDDDPTSNPDDGQVDYVEETNYVDEDILHEVRATLFKKSAKAWEKSTTGPLRVLRHKVTGKHRIVIRNQCGKVHLNVALTKGMKFDKSEKNSAKGKLTYLTFLGLENESKGWESFMLQVRPESRNELHALLESLTKS